jgi:hypothetical protein
MSSLTLTVRLTAEAKDFSSNLCVQTSFEVHPASCTMGTIGPFPGIKGGRGVTLTTHPHLVPKSRLSKSDKSSLSCRMHGGSGTALLTLTVRTLLI